MRTTSYIVCLFSMMLLSYQSAKSQGLLIGSSAYVRASGSPKLIIIDGNFKNDGNYTKGTEKVTMKGSTARLMHGSAAITDMYDLEISNTGGITTRLKQLNTHNTDIITNSKLTIDTSSYVLVNNLLTNNATASGLHIKANAAAPNGSLAFMNPVVNPVQATVEMYSLASWSVVNNKPTNVKWQFFGIPIKSSSNSEPLFTGAIVRKHNEAGSNTTSNLWIQLTYNEGIQNISGYELAQLSAKTYTFSGELFNQDINKTLTYTSKAAGAQYPGQHVFGNPYTAAIDVKQIVFGDSTYSTVYQYNTGSYAEWDAAATGKSGSSPGHYNVSTKNTAGDTGIPRYIAPMQGFVVRAKSSHASATISIPYASVVARNVEKLRAKKESANSYTVIDVTGSRFSDRMWLYYNPDFTRKFDNGWDALKLSGIAQAPQISGSELTGNFQIDAVPDFNNTLINFRAGEDTNYKMTFNHYNLENIYSQLYLYDTNTKALIDISQSGTEYTFSGTNTSTQERFKILTSAGLTTDLKNQLTQFYITINGERIVLNNLTGKEGVLHIYNLNGVEIFNFEYNKEKITETDKSLQSGIYLYKAIQESGVVSSGKFTLN